jgi:hypothetical protein
MYASLFEISGALHLDVFEQPKQKVFFTNLLVHRVPRVGIRHKVEGSRKKGRKVKKSNHENTK